MMSPETILRLRESDDARKNHDDFVCCYNHIAEYGDDNQELIGYLKKRVDKALEMYLARESERQGLPTSHSEEFYEITEDEWNKDCEDSDKRFDYVLDNEEDAEFANAVFTIEDIAHLQCGYKYLVVTGTYTEYAYSVLIRKGFIAELYEDWATAVRCYEGVSGSATVDRREAKVRALAKAEGEKMYECAQSYMESGEWSDVYSPLSRAADMGNADAMVDMGLARIYGQFGIPRDYDEGLKLIRDAVRKYSIRACMELVELYDAGIYEIQGKEALKACTTAAELGDPKAKVRLEDGFDLRSRKEILQEQINRRNADAIWMMYLECKKTDNIDEATEWLMKAIDTGNVKALLEVAEAYMDKESEEYDSEQAREYLIKAAEKGSVKAMLSLGDMELKDSDINFSEAAYQFGIDQSESQDLRSQHGKQLEWYEKAAECCDDQPLKYMLAMAYYYGYPVARDYKKAFEWAARGADEGDSQAMYMAAWMYELGLGTKKDINTAILLYTESADKGVRASMLRLYRIYNDGFENIPADREKSLHYLWLSGKGRE